MKTQISSIVTLIALCLAFSACKTSSSAAGASGGTTGGTTATKSFNSTWSLSGGGQYSVNMSGFNQGGSPVAGTWTMADGGHCDCTFTITSTSGSGDDTSGTFVTSGCTTVGTGEAASFCPCLVNMSTTYTHSGTSMEIPSPSCNGLHSYE